MPESLGLLQVSSLVEQVRIEIIKSEVEKIHAWGECGQKKCYLRTELRP